MVVSRENEKSLSIDRVYVSLDSRLQMSYNIIIKNRKSYGSLLR